MSRILSNGTTRIEVNGAWYELREEVGWYRLEATSNLSAIRLGLPVGIARNLSNIADLDPETPVNIEFINHERDLQRLTDRLCGWSHKAAIRPANIQKLSPATVTSLLSAIDELERAEVEGVNQLKEETPFD